MLEATGLHRSALPARARLVVDTDAIGANVRTIRRVAGTSLLAVVKADGFGCGMRTVARAALAAGASWLGTATIEEAVEVRRAGLEAPTLSWLHPLDADWDAALLGRIDLGLSSVPHLERVAAAARRLDVRARVHLHVDTGMARDGAPRDEWERLMRTAARSADAVEVVGIMGHLPDAARRRGTTARDAHRFSEAVLEARLAGLRPSVRHLAATDGALHHPAARFDLVRVGAGLHGIGSGLRPAAALTAPVVLTRTVRAGTRIGYGHEGRVRRDTVLALLPIGYADGVPRRFSRRAGVQLGGRRCPIVGRVSMDQTVVDVGAAGVPVGAVATVFGDGAKGEPLLADWARWSGTIAQDLLASVGPRVRRMPVPS